MPQSEEYPLISVIVPIYRVEEYLEKCIESILGQTYTNLEIILIDDGSDDACPDICDRYALQDERIKVIHKQNGGVASARNMGLMNCHGEYIAYVDPDDWILKDMFMILYELIVSNAADIVQCGAMDDMHPDRTKNVCEYVIKKEDAWDGVIRNHISVVLWGKLYRRKVWEKLKFEEGLVFEDALILPQLLSQCEKYVVTTDKLCWYTRRNSGIVRQSRSSLHMASKEKVVYEYEKYFMNNGLMNNEGAFYLCEMIPGYRNAIFSGVDINKDVIKRHNCNMHNLFRKYYGNARKTIYYNSMQTSKKIEWVLYVISPYLSYRIVAEYKKWVEKRKK